MINERIHKINGWYFNNSMNEFHISIYSFKILCRIDFIFSKSMTKLQLKLQGKSLSCFGL